MSKLGGGRAPKLTSVSTIKLCLTLVADRWTDRDPHVELGIIRDASMHVLAMGTVGY